MLLATAILDSLALVPGNPAGIRGGNILLTVCTCVVNPALLPQQVPGNQVLQVLQIAHSQSHQVCLPTPAGPGGNAALLQPMALARRTQEMWWLIASGASLGATMVLRGQLMLTATMAAGR